MPIIYRACGFRIIFLFNRLLNIAIVFPNIMLLTAIVQTTLPWGEEHRQLL